MSRRLPLPPELTGAPFRTREVHDFGVSTHRLEASDVLRVFHGVRTTRVPATIVERAEALATVLRDGEAFSHTTAARLWGIPLPRREDRIHVTARDEDVRMRRPGVVGHRALAAPVTMLGMLPVIDPSYTFFQLATLLAHDDLVAAGDYLVTPRRVARKPALASVAELHRAIPARARGAARARAALDDVRVGAESPMETALRLLLVRSGLPEPALTPRIELGDSAFHPDLWYAQWGLAIEYLGDQHRTDPTEWGRDITRREAFERRGHAVLAVTKQDVADPHRLLARVAHAIAERRRA